jgi:cytochrome bd ubiquinol oxidase subunit I
MELNPVILSRIQFAFVVSFHIIFPAFTIGLAAWLATIEGMRLQHVPAGLNRDSQVVEDE